MYRSRTIAAVIAAGAVALSATLAPEAPQIALASEQEAESQQLEEDIAWAVDALDTLGSDAEWRGQVFLITSRFLEFRMERQPLGYEGDSSFATGAGVALVEFARRLTELSEFVPRDPDLDRFVTGTVDAYGEKQEAFESFVFNALENRESFRLALATLAEREMEDLETVRLARRALLFMPLLSYLANRDDWIGLRNATYIWPFC